MHPFLPQLWHKVKFVFGVAIRGAELIVDTASGIPIVSTITGALGGIGGNVLGELLSERPEEYFGNRRAERKRLREGANVYKALCEGKALGRDDGIFATEQDKAEFFLMCQKIFDECEKAYEKWESEAKERAKEEKKRLKAEKRARRRGEELPVYVDDPSKITPPEIPLAGCDGKALVGLFTDYMYKENIEDYLKLSELYRSEQMSDSDRALLLEMLNGARESFLRSCYVNDLEKGEQVLISLFRNILDTDLEEKFKTLTDDLAKKLAPLNATLDDRRAEFVGSYEGVDEERLNEMFDSALERALESRFAQLGADNDGRISMLEVNSQPFSPKYLARKCPECAYSGEHIYFNEATQEFHCSACGASYSILKGMESEAKILGELDTFKKSFADATSETIKKLEALGTQSDNIERMASELVETVATQAFLQDCMNRMGSEMDTSFESMRASMGTMLSSLGTSVLERIDTLSDDIRESGDKILEKISAESATILASLTGLSTQMAQMQSDVMAMRQEARVHRDEILSVLLRELSTLKEQFKGFKSHTVSAPPVRFSEAQMCDFLSKSEVALTSYDTGTPVADISKMLTDLSIISNQIVDIDHHLVSKIPNGIRLDKGDTKNAFACPYCGTVKERGKLGDRTDRFKCIACGNEGFRINPLDTYEGKLLRNYDRDFWRSFKLNECEIDEILELPLEIERWRDAHRANLLFTQKGYYKIVFALTESRPFPEDKVYFISTDTFKQSGKTNTSRIELLKEIFIANLDGGNPMWDEECHFVFYSSTNSDNVLGEGVCLNNMPCGCHIYTTNKSKKIK